MSAPRQLLYLSWRKRRRNYAADMTKGQIWFLLETVIAEP